MASKRSQSPQTLNSNEPKKAKLGHSAYDALPDANPRVSILQSCHTLGIAPEDLNGNMFILDKLSKMKSAASLVEAKEKQKRNAKKTEILSNRQRKALGFYALPPDYANFEELGALHRLWNEYIAALTSEMKATEQIENALLRADLHGAILEGTSSFSGFLDSFSDPEYESCFDWKSRHFDYGNSKDFPDCY